ncbi:cytochrome P450 [Streptomyces noursei]|uniref:cytochrome P450 n=1 Tax=Streptomyces noursei TaxID=1971 RepID=UPI001674572C|nr:cytochrome P450 [Streptomyces noursei]MCZ1014463.1 cytochrome P450 [Streptomyces noursei]GGW95228.1 cytochrome P450 [Streptomyces noursei]
MIDGRSPLETARASLAPPPFPMDRTCPYHPPTQYRSLRDQGPLVPVTLHDGRIVWLVIGHAEVRALFADRRLSSNQQNPDFPVPTAREEEVLREVHAPLIGDDPPEHNVIRRKLIPASSLRATARLRPTIQRIVDEHLDRMVTGRPPVDLVTAFTLPVSSVVICELLGVPVDDQTEFTERSARLIRGPERSDVTTAWHALAEYLDALVAKKEAVPGNAVLDELIATELHEGAMSRRDLITLAMLLLVAGHETTSNMIALSTLTLLEHRDQLARFTTDEAAVPGAVEELLRFLSIADWNPRVATADIEIGGRLIRRGDGVFLSNTAANRDPVAFANPDVLDVCRSARQHVAFGFGIHQCLGQNLARAEIEIALSTLFARLPALRLAATVDSLTLHDGGGIQGVEELPVTW